MCIEVFYVFMYVQTHDLSVICIHVYMLNVYRSILMYYVCTDPDVCMYTCIFSCIFVYIYICVCVYLYV